MKLLDKQDNATATVISQYALEQNNTVYIFEVQDFSTYHIGEIGVWVHNHNCCDIQEIQRIANNFQNFECMECAEAIVNQLKKEGLHGEILEITTNSNHSQFGNIWSDTLNQNISTNGRHRAVMIGDKVYDNVHPNGISYEDWINDFYSIGEYSIRKEAF